MNLDAVSFEQDQDMWNYLRDNNIQNAIVLYQTMVGKPHESLNTIQMMHGVSFKSACKDGSLKWPPDRWSHVLIQGVHYLKPYLKKHADQSQKIHQATFARAVYYGETEPRGEYVLYMPTHKDGTKFNLFDNLELVCKLDQPVKVKLHPITLRNPDIMRAIIPIMEANPQVEFIGIGSDQYVNYHNLFKNSKCLISDFSSIICEYTLTDTRISRAYFSTPVKRFQ
ncbi:MAG: CDP-glycerol glycerophosphotransferase family protein [Oligoflexus sp.]